MSSRISIDSRVPVSPIHGSRATAPAEILDAALLDLGGVAGGLSALHAAVQTADLGPELRNDSQWLLARWCEMLRIRRAEEAIAAIDRYFLERNEYFENNPKRAGNKVWRQERVACEFKQKGAQILRENRDTEGNLTTIFVQDPNGLEMEIRSPR